ncbi:hypothetical protein AAFF_G00263330 [Aldrovandia affinis]|uniref:Uncharacterized protein n=1 Tax=Aldrovandia affinis TaxID=143900 RepID=A0AAD7WT68_9TELE|nr:hypothetical protein AAFF_G00263330 [Aldrovandia affinis]
MLAALLGSAPRLSDSTVGFGVIPDGTQDGLDGGEGFPGFGDLAGRVTEVKDELRAKSDMLDEIHGMVLGHDGQLKHLLAGATGRPAPEQSRKLLEELLDAKLAGVRAEILDGFERRLTGMRSHCDERIGQVQQQCHRDQVNGQEQMQTSLDGQETGIRKELGNLQAQIQGLTLTESCCGQVSSLATRVLLLEESVKGLTESQRQFQTALSDQSIHVETILEGRLEDIEGRINATERGDADDGARGPAGRPGRLEGRAGREAEGAGGPAVRGGGGAEQRHGARPAGGAGGAGAGDGDRGGAAAGGGRAGRGPEAADRPGAPVHLLLLPDHGRGGGPRASRRGGGGGGPLRRRGGEALRPPGRALGPAGQAQRHPGGAADAAGPGGRGQLHQRRDHAAQGQHQHGQPHAQGPPRVGGRVRPRGGPRQRQLAPARGQARQPGARHHAAGGPAGVPAGLQRAEADPAEGRAAGPEAQAGRRAPGLPQHGAGRAEGGVGGGQPGHAGGGPVRQPGRAGRASGEDPRGAGEPLRGLPLAVQRDPRQPLAPAGRAQRRTQRLRQQIGTSGAKG